MPIRLLIILSLFLFLRIESGAQDTPNKAYEPATYHDGLLVKADAIFRKTANVSAYAHALSFARREADDLLLAKIYRALAGTQRLLRNAKLIAYDSLALKHAAAANADSLYFLALNDLANDHLTANRLSDAQLSIGQMKALVDSTNAAQSYLLHLTAGKQQLKMLRFPAASAEFGQAYQIAVAGGDEKKLYECKLWIGRNGVFSDTMEKAVVFLLDVVDYYKRENRWSYLTTAYQAMGLGYKMRGNLGRATDYYNLQLQTARSAKDGIQQADALCNLAEIAINQKRYSEAEAQLTTAFTLFRATPYAVGETIALVNQAKLYQQTGRIDEARTNLDKASAIANRLASQQLLVTVRFAQTMLEAAVGNTRKAEAHLLASAEIFKAVAPAELKSAMVDKASAQAYFNKDQAKGLKTYLLVRADTIPESVLSFNPLTGADQKFDSAIATFHSDKAVEQEAKYKTRQVTDSLMTKTAQYQQQAEQTKQRGWWLALTAALLIAALIGGSYVHRKRKEEKGRRQAAEALQAMELEKRLFEEHRLKLEQAARASEQLAFRDVDHRTRNTFAKIKAIINEGKLTTSDAESLVAIEERIQPLMKLYETMAETPSNKVSLQAYFEKICTPLQRSYSGWRHIGIDVHAPQQTDGKTAATLGLIVNELVLNALKHAFEGRSGGYINVCLENEGGRNRLVVADNGTGFSPNGRQGLGMEMMKDWAYELRAETKQYNNGGAHFEIIFG